VNQRAKTLIVCFSAYLPGWRYRQNTETLQRKQIIVTGNRGREGRSDKKTAAQRPPKETQATEPMQPDTTENFASPQDFPPAYDNTLRLRQRSVL
jgi:hypothetical protein